VNPRGLLVGACPDACVREALLVESRKARSAHLQACDGGLAEVGAAAAARRLGQDLRVLRRLRRGSPARAKSGNNGKIPRSSE